ncbi:MAG: outer membrane beta-barrel protein [bacterium]
MKKDKHPVDDFFKEGLRGHQVVPSDAGRQRFLREAISVEVKGKRTRRRWILLLAAFGIISTAALLVFFHTPDPQKKGEKLISAESPVARTQEPQNTPETPITSERQQQTNYSLPPAQSEINSNPQGVVSQIIENPAGSVQTPSQSTDAKAQTQTSVPITVDSSAQALQPEISSVPDTLPSDESLSESRKPEKIRQIRDWGFTTSIYYSPEWMFNTLEGEKYVNNFGLEGSFRYGRYSVRTGVGLSITKGTNELLVEYNDYLGSYKQLDSITFSWDSRHYYLIPTYYTSNQDVWDSLMKLDYPKVVKRYTYLQIPLILGYDLLQKKRFSLGFRAGPVLSILLESKQLSGDYNPGMDRIIRINQITPDRIQTNWQVVGAVNFSLFVSKRISVEFEPGIKYYFNSVYEQSDVTKKPWSVGFRAAFTIGL